MALPANLGKEVTIDWNQKTTIAQSGGKASKRRDAYPFYDA